MGYSSGQRNQQGWLRCCELNLGRGVSQKTVNSLSAGLPTRKADHSREPNLPFNVIQTPS